MAQNIQNHMTRRGLLSLLPAAGLTGCTPSQTQRLKLTVNVIDNGILRSGSTIMQSTCWQTNNKLGGMGIGGCHVTGEAVLVDLKQHGYLFMILCGRKDFLIEGGMGGVMESKPEWDSKTWIVKRDKIPRLVAFTNTNDSRTVVEVDPENLEATYGKGVSLASVTAQYTDEIISSGAIEKALPWLTKPNKSRYQNLGNGGTYLTGESISSAGDLANQLQYYHFKGLER